MNDILKFFAKLTPKERGRIGKEIKTIKQGLRQGKKLKGGHSLFSVRVGKIRIIYYKSENDFRIHSIDWRDQVYRHL